MKAKIYNKIHNDSNNPIDEIAKIQNIVINSLPLKDKLTTLRHSLEQVKLTPNGENELVRLFVEGLGGEIYFPRKGDNSERFDAIIDFPNSKCVVEIEFPSTAILDAPRNLLDDYAVIKNRHHEDSNQIIPLVICWDLPNKRTDYWNVISDIESILSLKIKTLSILSLSLHYWTKTELDLTGDDYYLNNNNSKMFFAERILNEHKLDENDFSGYFSPFK